MRPLDSRRWNRRISHWRSPREYRQRRKRLWDAWQDLHSRNLEGYLDSYKGDGLDAIEEVPEKYFAWEAEDVLSVCKALEDDNWPIGDVQDGGDRDKRSALAIIAVGMGPNKRKRKRAVRALLTRACVYRVQAERPEPGVWLLPDDNPLRKVHWWLRLGIRDELLGLGLGDTAGVDAMAVDVDAAGFTTRGAFFRHLYDNEGMKVAAIRDQWQGMGDAGREAKCQDKNGPLATKQLDAQGKMKKSALADIVKQEIRRAK